MRREVKKNKTNLRVRTCCSVYFEGIPPRSRRGYARSILGDVDWSLCGVGTPL